MMQHRCSSSCGHGNMVGHCSCGGAASSAAAFSMFLSMPNGNHHTQCYKTCAIHSEDENNMYSFAASSVDCTLSLATPSTRRFNENEKRGMSSFCWDILQPSKQPPPSSVHKSAAAADTIVPRRCANCDTTSTPLWRNGPRGPKRHTASSTTTIAIPMPAPPFPSSPGVSATSPTGPASFMTSPDEKAK
nr:GATA transcription factor 19-like [Ipomoea batatas]